jgi:hypothetical protein
MQEQNAPECEHPSTESQEQKYVTLSEIVMRAIDYEDENSSLHYDPSETWHSVGWFFIRYIHSYLHDRFDAYDAAELVEGELMNLDEFDPWSAAPIDSGDPRAEFEAVYHSIRVPMSSDPLEVATTAADEFPLMPIRKRSPKYCRFVAIAGHLQFARPNETIAIPIVRFSEILGVEPKHVSNYRKWAVDEGLLVPSAAYNRGAKRAAHYSFRTELFNWVTGRQIGSVEQVSSKPLADSKKLAFPERNSSTRKQSSTKEAEFNYDVLDVIEKVGLNKKYEGPKALDALIGRSPSTPIEAKSQQQTPTPPTEATPEPQQQTPTPEPQLRKQPRTSTIRGQIEPPDYDARMTELRRQTAMLMTAPGARVQ